MTSFRNLLLAVALGLGSLILSSCSTTHLVRWGLDQHSVYTEPEGGFARGILKPFVTIIGFPVALVWDVVTFPFQTIFGVYPYGDRYMKPEDVGGGL